MKVIAQNLNTRNRAFMEALQKHDKETIARLAGELAGAGAELISIQCSLDGAGDVKILPMAVEAVTEATDAGICLDSRNVAAVEAALPLCKQPPLINFISAAEPENAEGLMELAGVSRASLVLRASRATVPTTLEAKLQIIEDLIEMANASDIPNERLYVDPSVVHIGRGMGQSHVVSCHECIHVMNEMVEPPIHTVVWISNISMALAKPLKNDLDAAFLVYLAGAELDAAMVNVLDPAIQKALYLIKSFRDEIVFTPADMARWV
ncbi:MAG: dihydropteroate synthase [Nitrospirae bacterium]|nr:dihydropteroate synthase [Nitrospirota bacterium]